MCSKFYNVFCRLDIVHLNECQLVTEASDEELGLYDDEDDSNGMT
jgi:hypothetical protein